MIFDLVGMLFCRLPEADPEVYDNKAWGGLDLPGAAGSHHGSSQLEYGLRQCEEPSR